MASSWPIINPEEKNEAHQLYSLANWPSNGEDRICHSQMQVLGPYTSPVAERREGQSEWWKEKNWGFQKCWTSTVPAEVNGSNRCSAPLKVSPMKLLGITFSAPKRETWLPPWMCSEFISTRNWSGGRPVRVLWMWKKANTDSVLGKPHQWAC